jgi:hypothetical protein
VNQQIPNLARNGSTAVMLPIAGPLGGLFVGTLRARGWAPDPFAQIACVVKWAVTGFFAGLAFVVLLAFPFRQQQIVSMRKLMVLVVVAGELAWFFAQILFGVIGSEEF